MGFRCYIRYIRWEFLGSHSFPMALIHTLSPPRVPKAPMAPGWAAPFPAWPVPPVMYLLSSSEYRSYHPSHLGARFRSPRVGSQRPGCAVQGVRITMLTICDSGYAKPPSYPSNGLHMCYFNNSLFRHHILKGILL